MKDKLEKKQKRFDYYQFLIDMKLYDEFKVWFSYHPSKSRYKGMHNFIVSKGLYSDFKLKTKYDHSLDGVQSFVHSKWLTE